MQNLIYINDVHNDPHSDNEDDVSINVDVTDYDFK